MFPGFRVLMRVSVITAFLPILLGDAEGAGPGHPYLTELETEVLEEVNLARTMPRRYAGFLEQRRRYYNSERFERPGDIAVITNEGVSAVDEAIEFLRRVSPVSPLSPSPGMSQAARDHVRDQGPAGRLGHGGKDASRMLDRVNRHGEWRGKVGENISYGPDKPRDVVAQLIVDDGIPSRGHRQNIFDPEFRVVGLACGKHESYRTMCVMMFAAEFIDAAASPPAGHFPVPRVFPPTKNRAD